MRFFIFALFIFSLLLSGFNSVVFAQPTAAISGSTTVCPGGEASLIVSFTGNAPWSIEFTDGVNVIQQTSITSNPFTLTVFPDLTTTYSLVSVADQSGTGSVTGEATITVHNNLPEAVITVNGPNPINSCGVTTLQAPVGYFYVWLLNSETILGANTSSLDISSPGSYQLILSDGQCTKMSAPIILEEGDPFSKPVISPEVPTGFPFPLYWARCAGGDNTLTGPVGYTSYQWYRDGSLVLTSALNTIDANVYGAGSYALRVVDGNGCSVLSDNYFVAIEATTIPVLEAAPSESFCQGKTVQLAASPFNKLYVSYEWSNGQNSNSINVGTADTYTLTVTDISGCESSSSITVNEIVPLPLLITTNGSAYSCVPNGSVQLQSAVTGSGYHYQWKKDGVGYSSGTGLYQISVNESGNFTLEISGAPECYFESNVVEVRIIQEPSVTEGVVCGSGTAVLEASGAISGQVYKWYDQFAGTVLYTSLDHNDNTYATNTYTSVSIYDNVAACESPKRNAWVEMHPSKLNDWPFQQCSGIFALEAYGYNYGAGGTYLWYDAPSEGTLLYTGSDRTFETPFLNESRSYYVDFISPEGCATTSRAKIDAIVITPMVTATGATLCGTGQTATLSASANAPNVGFFWFDSPTALPNNYISSGPSFTVNNVNETRIYYVQAKPFNYPECVSERVSVTVQVNQVPASTFSVSSACVNSDVTITYTGNATASAIYTWDFDGADVLSGSGVGPYVLRWQNAGAKNVSLQVTENGCSSPQSIIQVNVNSLPLVSFTGLELSYCIGSPAVFLNGSPSGGTFSGTGISGNTYLPNVPGIHTITYTYTDANGCTNYSDQSTTVYSLPVSNVTGWSQTACDNSRGSVTFSSGGVGILETPGVYKDGGIAPAPGVVVHFVRFDPVSVPTVRIVKAYTIQNACTTFVDCPMTVYPSPAVPSVSPSGPQSVCEGNSVALSTDVLPNTSYQWRRGDFTLAGATSASYLATTTGDYNVRITNNQGCYAISASTSVTVNPNPAPSAINVTPSTTVCEGTRVNVGVTYAPDIYVSYSHPLVNSNGGGSQGGFGMAGDAVVSGDLVMIKKNAAGCSTTTVVPLTVTPAPQPVVNASGPLTFCEGESVALSTTAVGSAYQWNLGGVAIPGATSANYTATTTGSYTITLTHTNGCPRASVNTTVTVKAKPANQVTTTHVNLCNNSSGSVFYTTSPGTVSFLYPPQIEQFYGTGVPGGAVAIIRSTASAVVDQTYMIEGRTVLQGCTTSVQIPRTVVQGITAPTVIAHNNIICQGGNAHLTALSVPGATYAWRLNGSYINGATSSSYLATSAGNYSVVATAPNTCNSVSSTVAVTASANPAPRVTVDQLSASLCGGQTQTMNVGKALQYTTNGYVNASGFNWPTGGAITIEFWTKVNSSDVGYRSAFSVGPYDGNNRVQAHVPWIDNILYWDYGSGTNGRISTSFASHLNKWTHVALVSAGNGGSFKAIYLDGVLAASSTASSDGPDVNLNGLWIGAFLSYYHKGAIDEFRIWDKVLSQPEVLTAMNTQVPAGTANLAGCWRMDEASGSTVYDVINNKNGSLVGGVSRIYPSSPLTYTWGPSEGINTTISTNAIISAPSSGSTIYTVTGTDAGGCSRSASVTIERLPCRQGLLVSEEKWSVNMYPNPASDELNLQILDSESENVELLLIDMNGKIVYIDKVSTSDLYTFSIEDLPSGVYTVHVSNNKDVKKMKLVIAR